MSYKLQLSSQFEQEAKKLVKKYPSLKDELTRLFHGLLEEPITGTPLGKNCYKIRLAIASKGRGKSGGARVITHVYVSGKTVYLLSIYDKSEKETLSDNELIELIKTIL